LGSKINSLRLYCLNNVLRRLLFSRRLYDAHLEICSFSNDLIFSFLLHPHRPTLSENFRFKIVYSNNDVTILIDGLYQLWVKIERPILECRNNLIIKMFINNSNNFQVEIESARPSSRTSRTRKTTWTRFWTSSSNSRWRRPQIRSRKSRRRLQGRRDHVGSVSSFKTMMKLNIRSNSRQLDQVKNSEF